MPFGRGPLLTNSLIFAAALFFGAATLRADAKTDWVFTPGYAFLPPDASAHSAAWRVLSQNDVPGLGHELIIGESLDNYLRIFMSGDDLSVADFRKRMDAVVVRAKIEQKDDLLLTPEIVPYRKTGAQLRLVFRTKLRGRDYYEAHLPLALGGKGLDLHYVAPLSTYPGSLARVEAAIASLRPYWTGEKFDHPTEHAGLPLHAAPPSKKSVKR